MRWKSQVAKDQCLAVLYSKKDLKMVAFRCLVCVNPVKKTTVRISVFCIVVRVMSKIDYLIWNLHDISQVTYFY